MPITKFESSLKQDLQEMLLEEDFSFKAILFIA